MQTDPYSLDRLQDIVQPEPVSWWPPAQIWWFVLVLVATWCLYATVTATYRWKRNAYRRQALRELATLQESLGRDRSGVESPATIVSALLKRVALVSFPREKVASLSGRHWLGFLNETCDQVDFTRSPECCLGSVSFDPETAVSSDADLRQVMEAARAWIMRHRAETME